MEHIDDGDAGCGRDCRTAGGMQLYKLGSWPNEHETKLGY